MGVRLPSSIFVRFMHQVERLGCSKNTLAKMAIVNFIEQEEFKEAATSIKLLEKQKEEG